MKGLLCALSIAAACVQARALEPEAVIASWLARQTNVQSWSAEFVQTRTLKALAHPLVSTGKVWFAAPQNFRWELAGGQTIAVRSNETMLVIYPRLQRAEKYDLRAGGPGEWKDALSLLQSGFPQSRADLDRQFKVLSVAETNRLHRLALQPRSAGARKMIPRIHVFLAPDSSLAATELVFADGSAMRNDFHSADTPSPAGDRFDLTPPPGFKVTEPLKAASK